MVVRAVVFVLLCLLAFAVSAACIKKNRPAVDLSTYYSNASGKSSAALKSALKGIMFYRVVRYEGNDHSKIPDLELVNRITHSNDPFFGKWCTLVQWHKSDAVSNGEKCRNNVINAWQGNRNVLDRLEYLVANNLILSME